VLDHVEEGQKGANGGKGTSTHEVEVVSVRDDKRGAESKV
jgi:hypothetical protein